MTNWNRNSRTFNLPRSRPSRPRRRQSYNNLNNTNNPSTIEGCIKQIIKTGHYSNKVEPFPKIPDDLFKNVDKRLLDHNYDIRYDLYKNKGFNYPPTQWSLAETTEALTADYPSVDIMNIQFIKYSLHVCQHGWLVVHKLWNYSNQLQQNAHTTSMNDSKLFVGIAKALLAYKGRNKGFESMDYDAISEVFRLVSDYIFTYKPRANPQNKLISIIVFMGIRVIGKLKTLNENEINIIENLDNLDFNPSVSEYAELIVKFQNKKFSQHLIWGYFTNSFRSPGYCFFVSRITAAKGLQQACNMLKDKLSLDDFNYGYDTDEFSNRKILKNWIYKIYEQGY